jgi:hypothetical protein
MPTTAYPDVYGYWLDVLWDAMPVHRELVPTVDGGRSTLPCPKNFFVETEPLDGEVVGLTATTRSVALARLLDTIQGRISEFDSYLERSGIIVIDDEPPNT